jgi:hypothetical protein
MAVRLSVSRWAEQFPLMKIPWEVAEALGGMLLFKTLMKGKL